MRQERAEGSDPRPLSFPVFVAVLTLPVIFVWLLLRSGYSADLRRGAFLYAAIGPVNLLLSTLADA